MKKTVLYLILTISLTGLILLTAAYRDYDGSGINFDTDNNGRLIAHINNGETDCLSVYPWYNEADSTYYLFLPDFAGNRVSGICGLTIDGKRVNARHPYEISEDSEEPLYVAYNLNPKAIPLKFEYVGNLPFVSVSIGSSLASSVPGFAYDNKNIRIESRDFKGKLEMYSNAGDTVQVSSLDKFWLHGNLTKRLPKQAYNIRMKQAVSLLPGIETDEWVLLALFDEGDKIHSKITYDMAKELGADEYVTSDWVNLYINGEYRGLYLITDRVHAFKDFSSSDAFLIMKEVSTRYQYQTYFLLDDGTPFVIRSKNKDSLPAESVKDYIQSIDDMISGGNIDYSMIDLKSFAIQFLLDKLSCNYDATTTSLYFHKLSSDKKLYAGPSWDYDIAYNEPLELGTVSPFEDIPYIPTESLDWFSILAQDDVFTEQIAQILSDAEPVFHDIIDNRIDMYQNTIEKSVKTDLLRWYGSASPLTTQSGMFINYPEKIRYLKYFISNRLEYLYGVYGIEHNPFIWTPSDSTHEVTFCDFETGEEIETRTVADGSFITEYPKGYESYIAIFKYKQDEEYSPLLPVLEDMILLLKAG